MQEIFRDCVIEKLLSVKPLIEWAKGKQFCLALSHDVDVISRKNVSLDTALEGMYRSLTAKGNMMGRPKQFARWLHKALRPYNFNDDPAWGFDRILAIEDRLGYRSTFFFFPEKVDNPYLFDCCYSWSDKMRLFGEIVSVREAMVELSKRNWEIGLHASISAATDETVLARQREALSEAIGKDVESVRMHYLRWDPIITPGIVSRAGFKYDSTVGFNESVGFRSGTLFPHPLFEGETGEPLDVLEVPLHAADSSLFGSATGSEIGSRFSARMDELLNQAERHGGCLVCNWHPNHASLPGWFEEYERVLEEASRRGATGISIGNAAKVMESKFQEIVEAS